MKKSYSMVLMLLATVFIFIACEKKIDKSTHTVKENHAVSVSVQKVVRKNLMQTIDFSGRVYSKRSVNVAPSVSGNISAVLVKEGDYVHKGDLIAVMDSTQYRQAKAQLESLQKTYDRMLTLKEKGAIPDEDFNKVEAGYKAAKAGYEFMQKNYEIRAPISGFVTQVMKKSKELYSMMAMGPGGPAILRIVNTNFMRVQFDVSDADISKLKIGQKALISVDSFPNKLFRGKVVYISKEADMMSGKFSCEVLVKNPKNELRANQFANVSIVLKERKNVLVVPKDAFVKKVNAVFVAKDDVAIKSEVKIGLTTKKELEVVSGLKENDLIITRGNVGLTDNAKIVFNNKD